MNTDTLLQQVVCLSREAGDAILDVYGTEFAVDQKADKSPLTEADRRAHEIIVAGLRVIDASIPVLSEESPEEASIDRRSWHRYWLVDPLDGTKEFVKRNGEFTVNIALIEDRRATLGVVHAPVMKTDYFGALELGAWVQRAGDPPVSAHVRSPARAVPTVVGSRSHRGSSLTRVLERLGPPRTGSDGQLTQDVPRRHGRS